MKICYQLPTSFSSSPMGPAEVQRRQAYLAGRAFPESHVEVREAADGPNSIESELEAILAVPGMLRAIANLGQRDFDAIILGCFGDPGLGAARELTRIPVIGPGQASAHLATQLGHQFAILTVVDNVIPTLRRLMVTYRLGNHLTEIRSIGTPVLELCSDKDRLLSLLTREGEIALRSNADVLVIGCMTMGFLDIATPLSERLQVPVVNPVGAALKAAEVAATLGLSSSRRAYPPATASIAATSEGLGA